VRDTNRHTSGLVVAAAQCISVRGALEQNIGEHLRFIEAAASIGVDLIVFPELSLTGYELDLARTLQIDPEDQRIEPLRTAAKEHGMQVIAGAPLVSGLDRPYLGAFLISRGPSMHYAKIHVHESEEAYFTAGKEDRIVSVKGVPTAIAICADTSRPTHAANAAKRGAELYVTSVFAIPEQYAEHASRLQRYAESHGMGVLMANYTGSTGGLDSAGKSAFWDEHGKLIARAGARERALVVARRGSGRWEAEVVTGLDMPSAPIT
jgi:predicted amidohydrolase